MDNLIAFCSLPGAASDVISGRFVGPVVVPDNHVKFGDPRSNRSRDISETVRGGIFDSFICCYSFRPEVVTYMVQM